MSRTKPCNDCDGTISTRAVLFSLCVLFVMLVGCHGGGDPSAWRSLDYKHAPEGYYYERHPARPGGMKR